VAQKNAAARILVEEEREGRTIVVDDLKGSTHQPHGAMPNTVHVIDSEGTVVYRTMWNDSPAVEAVRKRLSAGQDVGGVPAPFRTARPRHPDAGVAPGRLAGALGLRRRISRAGLDAHPPEAVNAARNASVGTLTPSIRPAASRDWLMRCQRSKSVTLSPHMNSPTSTTSRCEYPIRNTYSSVASPAARSATCTCGRSAGGEVVSLLWCQGWVGTAGL
jgi:hypothetical protein